MSAPYIFGLEEDEVTPPEPEPTPDYQYTAANFLQQLLSLLPPGLAWVRVQGDVLYKLLAGCAPEFARVQGRADQLLLEYNPATAVEMLPEHEFVNGLPDPCAPAPTTVEARQAALLARLRDSLGHNPADYVLVAESLGHAGTEVTRRPYEPFRTGVSRCGDRLYDDSFVNVFLVAYMANLASGTWTLNAVDSATPGETAPDDSTDAVYLLNMDEGGYAQQTVSGGPTEAQFDVWVRSPVVDEFDITLDVRGASGSISTSSFVVTKYWRRFSMRVDTATPVTAVRVIATESGGGDLIVWKPSVGEVDEILECRFSKIRQSHTLPEFRVIGDTPYGG